MAMVKIEAEKELEDIERDKIHRNNLLNAES